MDKGIYTSLSGAIASEKKLDSTANNIANANTTAYKKETPVFKEYLTNLEKQETVVDIPRDVFKPSDFYHLHGNERSYVSLDDVSVDFSRGNFKMTSNPFDLVITDENSFFEINTPLGLRYTRAGNFTIDSQNRLVTTNGDPVLSKRTFLGKNQNLMTNEEKLIDNPKNREIIIDDKNINIRENGQIYSGNRLIADLSLIEFEDIHNQLMRSGSNNFASVKNPKIKENSRATVLQGYVEKSNVNPTSEMISLIKAQRVFDGTSKAMSTYSDMASKAIELSDINK